ncbi:cytochrome P450 2J6-like isoform X2 [Protopterus annectens]|uniref:cytochrome P450 2J6-like isoform X2 n=1 Tax=Protopterus annectens TaxID=7888 RepID=UPI001CFB7217|nr:cytochrome P450 2J6-like isoform X2 [Protopterus annectens]
MSAGSLELTLSIKCTNKAMQYFWLTLTILLIGLLFHLWKRPRNFPPGPWSVPVIGHFLQLDYRYPIPDFAKLAKRYGNIFRIYLGSTPIILTHGFEAVKEVLVNHGVEFSHRPKHPAFNIICNTKGIVMAPAGQHWKEQRRFSIMVMRNFGMGKKSMEARIQEEIEHLVRAFEVQEDTPFDPRELINRAVGNIICSVLFGHRFNYEDNSFGQLIHPINENFKLAFGMWGEIYNTLPFLRCLPLPFQKIFKNMKVIHAFLKKEIEEHRETWTPDEPRDYIDSYLDEIEKRKNGKSCFNEDSLLYCLTDLLVAATDTTTSALTWILLMMMTYPDIQAKCYREICSLQQNKTDGFCYQDRCKFPFIHAVLHEVLRLKEIVSLVPRSVTQEITIHGYTIPKVQEYVWVRILLGWSSSSSSSIY